MEIKTDTLAEICEEYTDVQKLVDAGDLDPGSGPWQRICTTQNDRIWFEDGTHQPARGGCDQWHCDGFILSSYGSGDPSLFEPDDLPQYLRDEWGMDEELVEAYV